MLGDTSTSYLKKIAIVSNNTAHARVGEAIARFCVVRTWLFVCRMYSIIRTKADYFPKMDIGLYSEEYEYMLQGCTYPGIVSPKRLNVCLLACSIWWVLRK